MKKSKTLSVLSVAAVFFASLCLFGCSQKSTPPTPVHLISESEAEKNPVRGIDERQPKKVTGETFAARQQSLSEVLAEGFKPTFDEIGKDVLELYSEMRKVADRYIKNSFSDYERVHAFHDYIATSVEYDDKLYDRYLSGEDIPKEHDSFNLSGVFLNGKAVCDGIGKAFAALCNMEGIRCVSIYGEYTSDTVTAAHSWNKVRVDGKWYNVDVTLDSARADFGNGAQSFLHHGFFMVSDRAIENAAFGRHKAFEDIGLNPENEATPKESYPVYEGLTVDIGGEKFSAKVETAEELNAILRAVKGAKRTVGKLDIRLAFDGINPNRVGVFDSQIEAALKEVGRYDFTFDASASVRPYIQYPDGVIVLFVYK